MKVNLPDFLEVFNVERMVRLGRNHDGGYLVNLYDVEAAEELISFGIFDDWSFESDFCELNKVPVTAYDGSLNLNFWLKRSITQTIRNPFNLYCVQKYLSYKRFFSDDRKIIKKFVGLDSESEDFITLSEIFMKINSKQVFLKVDIEGSEYRILNDLLKFENQLIGAVIEFHDCDLHLAKIQAFVELFKLKVVHVHANNYDQVRASDKLPLVLEISFSSQVSKSKRYMISHDLDMRNNPIKEDYIIQR